MTTFTPFKGRTVTVGQQVEVYRNLHNGRWSIRDAQSRLVLGHASNVRLAHADFNVSEAGRQRVLQEKKKNVHAFVAGQFQDTDRRPARVGYIVTYNPYRYKTFVITLTEDVALQATTVDMTWSGRVVANNLQIMFANGEKRWYSL